MRLSLVFPFNDTLNNEAPTSRYLPRRRLCLASRRCKVQRARAQYGLLGQRSDDDEWQERRQVLLGLRRPARLHALRLEQHDVHVHSKRRHAQRCILGAGRVRGHAH